MSVLFHDALLDHVLEIFSSEKCTFLTFLNFLLNPRCKKAFSSFLTISEDPLDKFFSLLA